MYLITTSISPPHAFLYAEGLYLPAASIYNKNDLSDVSSHLTNAASNKNLVDGLCQDETLFNPACPQTLSKYWQELEVQQVQLLKDRIVAMMRRVVFSSPTIRAVCHPPVQNKIINAFVHSASATS
eukprot:m.166578 g.166578  ORF g.166578 m.166578 type:complete len:126 (+) comp16437_c0_seq30:218-595(+)